MTADRIPRRLYLAGVASVVATAGCLGGDDESGPETANALRGTEVPLELATTSDADLPTPVRGDSDADVTVSTYEDFACPHCRTYARQVQPKIAGRFAEPGTIRYERYDFPIPVHEQWSWEVASAARAVQAGVGTDAFWEYADLLYENQGEYSYDRLAELAGRVDADGESVRMAARDEVYRPVVEADRQRGRNRGVTGTPTVIVNGRRVDSSFDAIREAIENELG